jgi:hypothetical protein
MARELTLPHVDEELHLARIVCDRAAVNWICRWCRYAPGPFGQRDIPDWHRWRLDVNTKRAAIFLRYLELRNALERDPADPRRIRISVEFGRDAFAKWR